MMFAKRMLAGAVFLFAATVLAGEATVREIRVERQGAGKIDEASVLSYASVRVGEELSRGALARDVRALKDSGRYSYVGAEVEGVENGVAVVYVIQSKPRIRKIEIEGADEVGNRKIRDLLELGVGNLVDDAILGTAAQKVTAHYVKKYFPYSKVTWRIDEDPATGTADVYVKVKEGRRAKVRNIYFEGNTSIKPKVLRKAMTQKKWNFFLSWITGAGTYKPDDLETDVEALRKVYMDHGFLDIQVGEPRIAPRDEKAIDVTIPVREGRRYTLSKIALSGMKIFSEQDLRKSVTNRSSDVASLRAIEATEQALSDFYGSRGYIDNRVNYVLDADPKTGLVDVRYDIAEGHLAYINDVKIKGNTRTKDKVIRREVTVYPGEVYNQVKVRTSERRLRNLGYFSYVGSTPEETGDPTKYNTVFEVEEQKTGQFLVGVGFSSVDELVTFAELSQGNFDIGRWPPTGGGQKLKLRGTLGTARTDAELSFVEPWFLNRKLSLGIDIFDRDKRYLSDEYNQRNTGFDVSLAKALGAFNRISLTYGFENIDIYDVSTNASQTIQEEEGARTKSSLTLELSRDTRDSVFVPTRGAKSSIQGQLAGGPLAGETDIYSFEAQASQYWSVWFDHVLNLKGWIATVDYYGDSDRVPIFDRYALGGARTLRGFKYRDVGPKDENGESIGGNSAWYIILEYSIPIVEKLRFATFYDIGMSYPDAYEFEFNDYNSDVGVGVRIDIPGFPLRFDYAWPIETDDFNDDSNGRFQFSVGYAL
jgi:outer membrane protein insertion porin family